jgi:hypothetical protein
VGVACRQEPLEQQTDQLQRNVLESERWTVEQFQQPVAIVDLNERRHRFMAKSPIGLLAQRAEVRIVERPGDERPHDRHRSIDVGKPGQRFDLRGGKRRPLFRHVQPTI